ncbi:MAG: acyl-ACP thioesterase domain-containing protein [Aquihabitans sp.]
MMPLPVPVPPEIVPVPTVGRTFTVARRVRWGDTDPAGRLRLDALARYLQDVANDDTRDAGHDPFEPWLVRRTSLVLGEPFVLGELVSLTTFSGGNGSRWGERRTAMVGDQGGRGESAALWIFFDPVSGRPARITPQIHATYDEAAAGRTVSARLRHGAPPTEGAEVDVRPWPLRATDLDKLGHVNNAATWAAVEDELARRGLRAGSFAEIEYPDALELGDLAELQSTHDPESGALHLWLSVDGKVRASAVVAAVPRA